MSIACQQYVNINVASGLQFKIVIIFSLNLLSTSKCRFKHLILEVAFFASVELIQTIRNQNSAECKKQRDFICYTYLINFNLSCQRTIPLTRALPNYYRITIIYTN